MNRIRLKTVGKMKFYLNFLSLFLFSSFFEIFPIENIFINLQHCATNFVAPKNTKKNFNLRWPTLTNVNQRWLKFGQTYIFFKKYNIRIYFYSTGDIFNEKK